MAVFTLPYNPPQWTALWTELFAFDAWPGVSRLWKVPWTFHPSMACFHTTYASFQQELWWLAMTCFLTWGTYRKRSVQDQAARLFLGGFEQRVCWRRDCTSPLSRSEVNTRQCLHSVSCYWPKVRQWASCHLSPSLQAKIYTWGDSWWARNATFGSTASHLDTLVPSAIVWFAFFHSRSCIADQL